MRFRKPLFALLLAGAAAAVVLPLRSGRQRQMASPWEKLEPGLELGVLTAPHPSSQGDSKIHVLRIDPHRFELRLLNASAPGQGQAPLTAAEWSRKHGLVAAINASMYVQDGLTSVGLMRTRAHVNNPRLTKDKAVLAFDPRSPGMPPVKLIDRGCDDFDAWQTHYNTFVQSIRMVSCKGENVWAQGGEEWSIAAVGVDRRGRLLFIHSRSPYTPHDLIENLLSLPLGLAGAMYVEGGAQAQLYVRGGGREIELVGSRGTSLFDGGDNQRAWPVPNVIGIARR